mgnify:FL=1
MKLESLALFDPSLASEDKPHAQILAFYPQQTPMQAQLSAVGLATALTNLAQTFEPTAPTVHALHTKKRLHVIIRPEPSIFLLASHRRAADADADDLQL